MIRRLIPLTVVAALAAPGLALAQSPEATTTTTTTTPAEVAPAAPATARLVLAVQRTGTNRTVLTGSSIRIRGVISPYRPGQKAIVRIVQNGRKIYVKSRTIVKRGTSSGVFLASYKPKSPGPLTIRASHLRTAQLGPVASKAVIVHVLPRAIRQGTSGRSVRIMQQELKALGYVTGKAGSYDGRTQRAVMAFRKYTGMSRVYSADEAFFRKLARGAGAFKVRYPNHGRHVEGDLTHQVLALIAADGKVERVYPMSSGKPSTPTVLGSFRIYRKDYGTNAKGMVDASYFIRGYAIHGYAEVPTYAASHGCLRVPVPDARSISNWVRHNMYVDVYYR